MPKFENPYNIPEIRCIDDFRSLIKGEVYTDEWKEENLDKPKTKIFLQLFVVFLLEIPLSRLLEFKKLYSEISKKNVNLMRSQICLPFLKVMF